ncbi:hypothetical protein [Aurantiacibacter spongiae]|uniref:Uncharacterized protein n=1 Tax=Aurantiacibacter spongiae TaxID=2488860 RepID=A0A3N5CPN0_9SPHN|nr:hypothetical protein [Aurantiacibacter spongiae]RPF70316.1 hypothetical protein EG799_00735 [Aurantiacibacter spongiae]
MALHPDSWRFENARTRHRERLYWLTLLTGLANVGVLALYLADAVDSIIVGYMVGGMAGSLLAAGIRGRSDGYYQQLAGVGMRWTMVVLGILVLSLWLADTGIAARSTPVLPVLAGDAYLGTLILALAYHAGYAVAFLRDRLTARSGG